MARRLLPMCVALLAAAALPPAGPAGVGDEIVVMRDGGLTRAERADAGVGAGARPAARGRRGGQRRATTAPRRSPPSAPIRTSTGRSPTAARHVAADPLAGLLWGLNNTGQSVWWRRGTPDADIDAPQAWHDQSRRRTSPSRSPTPASTPGIRTSRAASCPASTSSTATPTRATGTATAPTWPAPIAAAENGAGVIGVAPKALVMPLRVLDDDGGGNSADVAAAFAYAGDRGVRVVNASLGSSYPSLVERRAIHDHPGTLYVVAAGNGGPDGVGDDNDGATREYPCAHDEPNLVCVGATDSDDARAAFSNYGAASVDLFAPGQDIVSSWARGRPTVLNQYFGTGDGYEIMQGTSMASPHVAGAAALAAAVRPGWSGSQLRTALIDGADRLPGLAGASVSGGRLNAAASVRIAAGLPPARRARPRPARTGAARAGREPAQARRTRPGTRRAPPDQPPADRRPPARLPPPGLPGAHRDALLPARGPGRRHRPPAATPLRPHPLPLAARAHAHAAHAVRPHALGRRRRTCSACRCAPGAGGSRLRRRPGARTATSRVR